MASSKATAIRLTLSRELTWAEREALRDFVEFYDVYLGHSFGKNDLGAMLYLNVYAKPGTDSRQLAYDMHNILGTEFVNVFIRSIKTIYPKVKV